MGLIFLRHAFSRFLKVRAEIEPALPKRGGQTRPLTKEDFSGRGAIYLQPTAQFDYLSSLPDSADRAAFIGRLVNFTTGVSYPAVRAEDFESADLFVPSEPLLRNFSAISEPIFRQCKVGIHRT